jgi:hypothetical protein
MHFTAGSCVFHTVELALCSPEDAVLGASLSNTIYDDFISWPTEYGPEAGVGLGALQAAGDEGEDGDGGRGRKRVSAGQGREGGLTGIYNSFFLFLFFFSFIGMI